MLEYLDGRKRYVCGAIMNPTVQAAKKDRTQILVRILGSKALYGGCWETPRGWRFQWGPDWGDHTAVYERDTAARRKKSTR